MLEEPTRKLVAGGKARVTTCIDVADIDGRYARLGPALATLPSDRVEPLKNMPYHQREFQARMPDGDWLTFTAPIGRPGYASFFRTAVGQRPLNTALAIQGDHSVWNFRKEAERE